MKAIRMKSFLLACLVFTLPFISGAQVNSVSLQASGLTCSMCSRAVLAALEKVESVEKVKVDIKSQQYHISFRDSAVIDLDALSKAVEDAGFSVAGITVTARLAPVTLKKDEHVQVGRLYFHFLNADGQELKDIVHFKVVDKNFTTAKEYKKYSAMSKMECVQTGRMASCCTSGETVNETRIYHAVL